MHIRKVEILGSAISIRYTDGSREEISGGIYERKNTAGDTVEQRVATATDTARLTDIATAYEAEIKPLDAVVVDIQIVGASIDVRYDDGTKESLDGGLYEVKDANNKTIFERAATAEDTARLLDLEVGQTGNGEPGTAAPIVIDGTAGDDRIDGGSGEEQINGLDGDDRLRGRGGDDEVNGGNGNDRVRGDSGNDTVSGGAGDDRVKGGRGDDVVMGDDGNDRVKGSSGNDTVSGGNGDDRVKGGRGDDVIDGDAGSDHYHGGLGADTFVFSADGVRDKIHDFEDGLDKIDISAFNVANAAALSMSQAGLDVLIDLGGGDVIKVDDVSVAQLTDADFIF